MRDRIRGLLAGTTAVALVVLLAACGGSSEDTDTGGTEAAQGGSEQEGGSGSEGGSGAGEVGCAEAEGAVVGYSQPLPDPNFEFIAQIIEAALEEHGATLQSVNANLDPGKQVSDINTLIQSGVDVLIANPIDPNATQPAFDRARDQDIPIVAQETTVGGPFFTNVTADVESAAQQGAELLAEAVGDGQVVAINGPAFAEVIVRENEAFAAAAEENGLDVVDTQVNQQITPQAAQSIATAWRDQYGGDLAGIWTFNDTSALGAASAFSGGEKPAIVSINGQPEIIPLIEGGDVLATFDLQQDKLGQGLAYAALAAICGQEVPEEIVVPVQLIDQSTVGDYRPLEERVGDEFDVQFEERDGRTFIAG